MSHGATTRANDASQLLVGGYVRNVDGSPASGIAVTAFDVDLRNEEPLGRSTTDKRGHYFIPYSADQFRRAEKASADLRVRVFPIDASPVQSQIVFNAPAQTSVDLVVGGVAIKAKSEYSILIESITPVLDGLDIASLNEEEHQDLTFIVGETGVDRIHLESLIQSHILKDKARKVWKGYIFIDPRLFYGLLRKTLGPELMDLLQTAQRTLLFTIRSAVSENIIDMSEKEIKLGLSQLAQTAVRTSSGQSALPLPNSKVANVLGERLQSSDTVMNAFAQAQSTQAFWDTIRDRPESRTEVDRIGKTLQFAALSLNHAPLVKHLIDAGLEFPDLAQMDEGDWLNLIEQIQIGFPAELPAPDGDLNPDGRDPAEQKRALYASAIVRAVEASVPSEFIKQRLLKANTSSLFGSDSAKEDFAAFFSRNPDFDVRKTRITAYLGPDGIKSTLLENVVNKPRMVSNLGAIQRLYPLVSQFTQVEPLLKSGITSALQIARMGRVKFVNEHSQDLGGAREAERIFNLAHYTHSLAFTLFANLGGNGTALNIPAIPEPAKFFNLNPPTSVPDWSSMFGPADMCSCDGCHSMGSPAAYFVDILHFLKDRHLSPPTSSLETARSPKDRLFDRRPDLGEIELTCNNTKTPIPYIDLALEILEDAVKPLQKFSAKDLIEPWEQVMAADLAKDLDQDKLTGLVGRFALSKYATVSTDELGKRWTIDEVDSSYTIEKTDSSMKVTRRSRQTTGSAKELAANPKYINLGAYKTLEDQIYPFELPFNLHWLTVRTYLRHLGVNRSHMMRKLSLKSDREVLLDYDIALDDLGLFPAAAALIVGKIPPVSAGADAGRGIWSLWGFPAADLRGSSGIADPVNKSVRITEGQWSEVLTGRVDVFLQQGRLEYLDLLNLAEVVSVFRPKLRITIDAVANAPLNTCRLDQLSIHGLDAELLHNIIRFLRLWRTLSTWSILDLAQAARVLSMPEDSSFQLDETALVRLSNIQTLQQELEIPISSILAFFGDLDNSLVRDHSTGDESVPPVSSFNLVYNDGRVTGRSELHIPEGDTAAPGNLLEHVSAITAALSLSPADVLRLVASPHVVDGTETSFANLSALHRHSILAQAIAVPIADYLVLLDLIDSSPFRRPWPEPANTGDPPPPRISVASPVDTITFTRRAKAILASPFSVHEVNYLLLHKETPGHTVALKDIEIASILVDLRDRLQRIATQNIFDPGITDDKGELVKQKLALLSWDSSLIAQAIGILGDTASFDVKVDTPFVDGNIFPLSSDPNYVVSPELRSKFTYDELSGRLVFQGVMTAAQLGLLRSEPAALSNELKVLLQSLYDLPRLFMQRNMRAVFIVDYKAALEEWPSGVEIPTDLQKRLYYDEEHKELQVKGALSALDKQRLDELAPAGADGNGLRDAIKTLFNMPLSYTPPENAELLTETERETLFSSADTFPAQRFTLTLSKLIPYLRNSLSNRAVTQAILQPLDLDIQTTDFLLDRKRLSPSTTLRATFLASKFLQQSPRAPITKHTVPDQFKAFVLLHKIALVIARLRLTFKQTRWLFDFRQLGSGDPANAWLDLQALPLEPVDEARAAFVSWERLLALINLRDAGLGEEILDSILTLSRKEPPPNLGSLLQPIKKEVAVSASDLDTLVGPSGFNVATADAYKDEALLLRVFTALRLFERVGLSATDAIALSKPDISDIKYSHLVIQTTKSRYDTSTWDSVARPLRNVLRERQRAALVAYLLANPSPSGRFWHGPDDLFSHYLIDVEMGPCQLTTRLKQAICSVQLFTQRCLMNLEDGWTVDSSDDPHWDEWDWMKYQNVHGANWQVLINPENYMESDLRDDQTEMFKAFRSELQQGDITADTVTAAFNSYVERLADVARLQVISLFEEEASFQKTGNDAGKTLHVVARTYNQRPVYYYRRRVDSFVWKSGWIKIDADIEGNHVLPIVWNGRLHIFWATFFEKQEVKAIKMPGTNETLDVPDRFIEIGLSWSVFDGKKFGVRKNSSAVFRYPRDISSIDSLTLRCAIVTKLLQVQVIGDAGAAAFKFVGLNSAPELIDLTGEVPTIQPPGRTRVSSMAFRESSEDPADGTGGDLWLNVPRDRGKISSTPVLTSTPGSRYTVVSPPQDVQFLSQRPFFFQHDLKSFLVEPKLLKTYVSIPKIPFDPVLLDPSWLDGRAITSQIHERIPYIPKFDLPYPNPGDFGLIRNPPTVSWDQGTIFAPNTSTQIIRSGLASDIKALSIGFPHSQYLQNFTQLEVANQIGIFSPLFLECQYKFSLFYHPFVHELLATLGRDGVDGLLQRPNQLLGDKVKTFESMYKPWLGAVLKDEQGEFAEEVIDFGRGAYSIYNRELFFYIPLMIAEKLSKNQKFQEAQRWFHYIFDPTDTSTVAPPQKYWRTGMLFKISTDDYHRQTLPEMFRMLALRGDPEALDMMTTEQRTALETLEAGVNAWRKDPFKPFLVAETRFTSFQKTVVMKYLDNLIAWGDSLFRSDTIEKINQATQIYILAAEILGDRPREIPARARPQVQTYNSLEPRLDSVSNGLVPIEELLAAAPVPPTMPTSETPVAVRPSMLFFCIPKNERLLSYWDTVADRLFKIRNCMNLQGITRQLPMFDPPINPALLVRAAAAGMDLTTALSDINAPLPFYRFQFVLQRALEICGELKSLGSSLMAALERKDSESMSLMRSRHETTLNDLVKLVRDHQVTESSHNAAAVRSSKAIVQGRLDHYSNLPFMNEWEATSVILEGGILAGLGIEAASLALAGGIFSFPDVKIGAPTSIGATLGGGNFGKAAEEFAAFMHNNTMLIKQASGMAVTQGSYWRRNEDWTLQKDSATNEMAQIDKQILAADIRVSIAEQERKNHVKQTENAKEIDSYMQSKFNNAELYDWNSGQLSTLYMQTYQLAYDIAKRAEKAYCHELGLESASFIQFGYWDSLKRGLLAGEKLHHDLKRMELSYQVLNAREYEITSNFSLAQLDPLALMQLRENGDAFFSLPEAIFDIAYPGHYFRRIKSVSVTLPCLVGPYTNLGVTLTLLKSSMRTSPLLAGGKYARSGPNDSRFRDTYGQSQSVVTSMGQNDHGLFETSLRDDSRTLPFERAGAVSSWRVQLPAEVRQFDYRTLSDVMLHVSYTAREGGDSMRAAVQRELKTSLLATVAMAEAQNGLARLVSLRPKLNSLYGLFSKPSTTATTTTTTTDASPAKSETVVDLSPERFPFLFRGATITINKLALFVFVRSGFASTHNKGTMNFWLLPPAQSPATESPTLEPGDGGGDGGGDEQAAEDPDGAPLTLADSINSCRGAREFNKTPAGQYRLRARLADGTLLKYEAIEDILVLCYYSVAWGSGAGAG